MTLLSPGPKVLPIARGIRNGVVDQWRLVSSYPRSLIASRRYADAFCDVEAFCLFLGSGRSGHTLVGSLLNAHSNVVIGNELDVLQYLRYGISRDQLFALILRQDAAFASRGHQWEGYSYAVPNQWQGRFKKLQIIGDKKSGMTSLRLARVPGLLDRLRAKVGVPLRFVHHVRNPYDNIATIAKQRRLCLAEAADHYFARAVAAMNIIKRLDPSEIIETRHEQLVGDPTCTLDHLSAFLGVRATPDYLAACAACVHAKPRKTRHTAPWSREILQKIESRMKDFWFFSGYSYED